MNRPVWTARTGSAIDGGFLAYSQTTGEDAPYVVHDLAGSSAHVLGLHHVGLLDHTTAEALLEGLQDLHKAWTEGSWTLDASLEDVHMNIEAELTQLLGDAGKRLHTGRSRNDQVATCITLFAREGLAHLAASAGRLATALMAQAETHQTTPWVARTHGQVAQPATLGFLLAAHAARFQDVQQRALQAFDAVGESPLGGGAVAGSTLPLEPNFTADLLGLRPMRSALLATGARDTVLTVCQVASQAGLVAAGLAQDLLDLFGQKMLHLPAGLTTGSSLMPQKRNPDALELARGKGHGLQGPLATVTAITSGLGLGYMRDLQATKPALTQAIVDSVSTLDVLATAVQGARFDVDALTATLNAPGITATDLAEALVATGMPFRDAYQAIARLHAAMEAGDANETTLGDEGWTTEQVAAVMAARTPDPARRATWGGPAPAAVVQTLQGLGKTQSQLDGATEAAQSATQAPLQLLSATPSELLEAHP